ncbi:MAG: hypothetical protein KDB22_10260 [Planctomycetales bacterium]|nr:hypothetical protein [Planctomycetales bacterium]
MKPGCSSSNIGITAGEFRPTRLNRREFLVSSSAAVWAGTVLAGSGCTTRRSTDKIPDLIWGRRGFSEGRLQKPRAMAISDQDEVYLVDILGRIQVYTHEGEFLRGWRTPMIAQGKPTGLAIGQDGSLLVPDTHYYRVLFYSSDGVLDESRTIGGINGDGPGEFHFVTDVVQDARGHFLVGQYGQIDRIQEFSPSGEFIRMWGTQGSEFGEFSRPQSLIVDGSGLLWVADACNHRIQVFDVSGAELQPELVDCWGKPGSLSGQLQYPYGLIFDHDGTLLVVENGNHRVQRFDRSGRPLEMWGTVGKDPGQFLKPWALGLDSQRRLQVLDTQNHRVQRFDLG